MLSFMRNALSCSLVSFALCASMVTPVIAQSPCIQSPEALSQTAQVQCQRCSQSLCDFSCFSCDRVAAAAAACTPRKTCSTAVAVPNVSMTVGTQTPDGCNGTGLSWGMRNINGPAQAQVTCVDGKVTQIQGVIFAALDAQATGSRCGWSYTNMEVKMTWSAGRPPSLSITGWPKGETIITDLAATATGAQFSLTGKAAAPLSGGSGRHHHAAVDLQLPLTVSCSCP